MKDFHLPHPFSERFFENWGGPRAQELFNTNKLISIFRDK